jgi:hypothetical protein
MASLSFGWLVIDYLLVCLFVVVAAVAVFLVVFISNIIVSCCMHPL